MITQATEEQMKAVEKLKVTSLLIRFHVIVVELGSRKIDS